MMGLHCNFVFLKGRGGGGNWGTGIQSLHLSRTGKWLGNTFNEQKSFSRRVWQPEPLFPSAKVKRQKDRLNLNLH